MSSDEYFSGFSTSIVTSIRRMLRQTEDKALSEMLDKSRSYLTKVKAESAGNSMINASLASAINEAFEQLCKQNSTDKDYEASLKSCIRYFITEDDDESDMHSPIGFEDDAEVLNAFMKFYGMDDLMINIEEYDEC